MFYAGDDEFVDRARAFVQVRSSADGSTVRMKMSRDAARSR
jgi:hypothetical protein